ncbi:hypothetical protein Q4603_09435 [Zobellia galactanivorans]|uniref:hypothetical protein n=1 Tax=Zobellia galactanivorans (strain DSM 12802 / CCUG 47099 / CIP 106680 / NCIMB 13871 / Dsij) TaxID=63186 RepID=UPI0026E20CDF|nr:hypothetical protein [Zobellia galactanivorans]MDO6808833.1 hypothetical protein [Zobellia galactanivorans]
MKRKLNLYSGLWAISLLAVAMVLLVFNFDSTYYIPNPLNIQFSANMETFTHLIGENSTVLRRHTLLDFFFILLYSFLFLFSVKIFELSLEAEFKWYYYALCLVPGLADILENFLLLNMLDDHMTTPKFCTYYWAVRLKWSVIIAFILMSLTILLYYGLLLWGRTYNFLTLFFKKKGT